MARTSNGRILEWKDTRMTGCSNGKAVVERQAACALGGRGRRGIRVAYERDHILNEEINKNN